MKRITGHKSDAMIERYTRGSVDVEIHAGVNDLYARLSLPEGVPNGVPRAGALGPQTKKART
ncbi:MAG: hypothetical protein JKY65_30080 [Planctomycetes bacterium]|nr:hypothetical protein [Planctomycetota bacterium]